MIRLLRRVFLEKKDDVKKIEIEWPPNTLRDRKIVKESERSNFNQSDYIILYQFFLGKGDFFFCHWYAIDEQAILDRLAAAGGDKFFITMATVIDAPKINAEVMQSYLLKLK